jgi:hypothetical protein
MEPADQHPDQEKKIKSLELELNDLRQGLAIVTDYYIDLEKASRQHDAAEVVDRTITRHLVEDEHEFEGIWRFHEEMLVADPEARVTFQHMYDAFVDFCTRTHRQPVEPDAFVFVFSQMENPAPEMGNGEWIGFRLHPDGA